MPQPLNLLFTVSCRRLALPCMSFLLSGLIQLIGHLIWCGASPIYPSFASTLSRFKKINQWIHKYIHVIIVSSMIRSIDPHNTTRLNVQRNFVRKSWLLIFMTKTFPSMLVHLKSCSIASDQILISYITFETIFKYNLNKRKGGEITQPLIIKENNNYLLPVLLNPQFLQWRSIFSSDRF